MKEPFIKTGIPALDEVIQGLRVGDNVVWQVDDLEDYRHFAQPFVKQAIISRRKCVYLRFAPHPEVVRAEAGLDIVTLDPGAGFDSFSRAVQKIVEENGPGVFYVFDNLSALVGEWATDELLANFFKLTCPFLYEMDTIAYFALTRGQHSYSAVARIRDTTQVLIDVYRVRGQMYINPIKVGDRYSPQMFVPHIVSEEGYVPVFQSGEAAAVATSAKKRPLPAAAAACAPWDSIFAKLQQRCEIAQNLDESDPELSALKRELSRMLLGNHPEFSKIADRYFTLEDLLSIRERMIGSGRIGGKAVGMLLARKILGDNSNQAGIIFSQILEDHDSFYIGSDVFFTFLVENDLFRLRLRMTSNSEISREEFEEVEQRFLAGKFPEPILEQFRNLLDYYGQAPIIVRSSSLLEDSFGNAFAGKYRSEFCANQGNFDTRLESFLCAVKLVYASALNPHALSYRQKRGLGESDEQMAILVQRVSGIPYRHYFFPALAGVAFSKNLYTWSDRIDPDQGIIRMVFGLGTRAVERVGGDYPRMIAISHPLLRPETGIKIAKYSQKMIDLIDLKANEFASKPLTQVIAGTDYPNLFLLVSNMNSGFPQDPVSNYLEGPENDYVLTFNNLIARTDFIKIFGTMMQELERAYNHPVDTEFTASLDHNQNLKINLLQCRSLYMPSAAEMISIPENIGKKAILFRSNRMIGSGVVSDLKYILFIDPKWYSEIKDYETKKSLGRLVGKINKHPKIIKGKIMMMGPGRWGSSNIDLGINVGYADIDNASVLVEIAREEAGHSPEISYGTHFFQDLVEAQIIFVPVYPDDPKTEFNPSFFYNSANSLRKILPDAKKYEKFVKLINIPESTKGKSAQLIANPGSRKAICFLQ